MSAKVLPRSLSSIHILYNQALVGGLSDSFDPATRIANVKVNGGSKRSAQQCFFASAIIASQLYVHRALSSRFASRSVFGLSLSVVLICCSRM